MIRENKYLKRLLVGGVLLIGVTLFLIYSISAFHSVPKNTGDRSSTKSAIELMRYVRSMANDNHVPREGTFLKVQIEGKRESALCNDYANVLRRMIKDLNVGDARTLNVSFNPNGWDMHTLVEYFDEGQEEWILLDPTFSMFVKRKTDGMYATAEDMQSAALGLDWSELEFILLDDRDYDYYLDYSLLFLNLHKGSGDWKAGARPLTPYLDRVQLTDPLPSGWYLLQYVGQEGTSDTEMIATRAKVNGMLQTLVFDGIQNTSKVFGATSISIPQNEKKHVVVYKPKRYIFTSN